MDDLRIPAGPGCPRGLVVPAGELVERFSHASGPGGQGVNTADSRVQLSLTYNLGITDYYRAYPYGIRHAASAYGVRSNTWMFSAAVLF